MRKKGLLQIVLGLFVIILLCCPAKAKAANFAAQYMISTYDSDDGLSSMEVNALIQNSLGYIWAGTYSGLYEYDGRSFKSLNLDERIRNVMVMINGTEDDIWIGTNDSGLAHVEPAKNTITFYTVDDGLDSNSIRSLLLDKNGNLIIGTAGHMSILEASGELVTLDDVDLSYFRDFSENEQGVILGTTNSGLLFSLVQDGAEWKVSAMDEAVMPGADFHNVIALNSRLFLVGDTNSRLYLVSADDMNSISKLSVNPGIGSILCLKRLSTGDIMICGENGIGYMDYAYTYQSLPSGEFASSVSSVIEDYQGNIWIGSSKQGVLKLSKNPFTDILALIRQPERSVNAVQFYEKYLFIGCDDGLEILDSSDYRIVENELTRKLEGIRVRNINIDSKNRVWISTYGADGLICYDGSNITTINENKGAMGSRFRSSIELSDGTILAASSTGLTYISGKRVIGTLGEEDGLKVSQILSLVERPDGSVLAGSDGDGIYVLKEKEIVGHIGINEGLETLVVLRIVPCTGGYLYITSNALYYDQDGEIRKLRNFPYTNNYDLYVNTKGMAWVSSSAGIYVCAEADLLADEPGYQWQLLSKSSGLRSSLTANAWNCIDEKGLLFLCCSNGVLAINAQQSDYGTDEIRLNISSVLTDDGEITPDENGEYVIPKGSNRVMIDAEVLNYSLANPLIHYYLEGFDHEGYTMSQTQFDDVVYTNLPHGSYTFHLQILNRDTKEVIEEKTIAIFQKAYFYNYYQFWVLFSLIIGFLLIQFTWQMNQNRNLKVITQQYKEIELAKKEADRANQYKNHFLTNMSHEIRTPINTIMGMDELILREQTSPLVHQYASDIYAASNSLMVIVNDVLDLSRMEYGQMELHKREFDTAEVLTSFADSLTGRALDKKLKCYIEMDSELPSRLYGDVDRLEQVLQNLFSNAVKFTHEGSISFRITLEQMEEKIAYLRFSVSDTGIGIKDEDMAHLFEMFEKLQSGSTTDSGNTGVGLGLTIAQKLLHLMDSDMSVDSIEGQGSDFHFLLPLEIIDPSPIGIVVKKEVDKAHVQHKSSFTTQNASALIVDDTALNLAVARGLLRTTRISVDTAKSGEECLQRIREKAYDIIFLDHMMPERDGYETLKRMKEMDHLCKDTPIVALTANAAVGAREQYLEMGFDEYLSKPLTSMDLERMLLKLLPPEKIIPADENENQERSYSQRFMGLSHLHPGHGIANCAGDEELYLTVLSMFAKEYVREYPALINASQKGDLRDFLIHIRRIHGSAVTIGATELAEKTRMMENAANESNWELIHKEMGAIAELYRDVVEEMKHELGTQLPQV